MLYQALVKQKQVALSVDGGVNWPLGNPFEYNGPTLMTSFIVYPPNVSEDALVSAYNDVIKTLATNGPSIEDLSRISAKMRSDWYGQLEIPIDRASSLAHATLFDGDPDQVYAVPGEVSKVTPDEVRAFAAKYLVPANRTIINRVPEASKEKSGGSNGGQQ